MEQAEWDKLLPVGMQWVVKRKIQMGDMVIWINGRRESAEGLIGYDNNGSTIRAYCPIEPAINIGTKEEPKLLTDHARFCRLSKQPGGLCDRMYVSVGHYPHCKDDDGCYQSTKSWTHCAHLDAQQPVELPKDPLEELIRLTSNSLADLIFVNKTEEQVLREFAEKVMAL